jgi:WD40 repeat protein/serine/threonine protein kinase/tetratricopeptide (TPR) repeat protein
MVGAMPMSESTSGPDLFNLLADEFAERYRNGERPHLSEYTDKYPELADQICELFPALVAMEQFGNGSDQATGSLAQRREGAGPMPDRLGDYRILREIARGGMGVVYEAVQESLGRHVALKVLPHRRMADASQLQRFQREARAAAMLHHTNIVPVFGVGEHDGVHYYAMQYIQGQSLDAVLHEVRRLRGEAATGTRSSSGHDQSPAASVAVDLVSGRFAGDRAAFSATVLLGAPGPPSAGTIPSPTDGVPKPGPGSASSILGQSGSPYYRGVARIGMQAAEALAYAHHQKVLHRDIKPSNLLLDLQGTVWVTDFGLAKAEGTDALTRTGDIVGTLRYMAPERFKDQADARSDVYALGLTLYEMLTLEPAFVADERPRLIDKILHDEPSKPRQLDPQIPRDLETITLKAVAKDPSDRYRTASDLAEDLRRYLADRPILARRASGVEHVRRWCRRYPALAGATAAVAVALVAVTVLAVLYADREHRLAMNEQSTTRRITALNERLESSLAGSNRLLAIRNFDRGQAAFDKGEIAPGLLWMIESWRSAFDAGDPAWQHAARANLVAWQPHHPRLKGILSHPAPVDSAVFSPDGKLVVTGSDDRTAQLWDAATARSIGQPLRHEREVMCVAFSPDGKSILTGSQDKTARLWDAATGQPIGSTLQHPDHVLAVAFSPDGKIVLTGCMDGMARLWDAATGRLIGSTLPPQGRVDTVAFSRDGKVILSGHGDGGARLWDAATVRPIEPPLGSVRQLRSVALSPDGKTVLTGSQDATVQLWDAATGQPIGANEKHHSERVLGVAFSPDGKLFLTGSTDKTARLWDAGTRQPIGPLLQHQGPVVAVAFSPDGKTFLTASSDSTVKLWDADPGQPVGLILGDESHGKAAFSPDGKSFLNVSSDRLPRLRDAVTGLPIGPPLRDPPFGWSVAISPDGKMLLTGSGRSDAQRWDAATGRPIGKPLPHPGGVVSIAFSPDGKTIVTGGQDHTVRLWDAATGTPLCRPLPQPGSVEAVAFSPDGKAFLTAYDIGAVQLWDLATLAPLGQPFPHPGGVSAAEFSPDGKILATGCEDFMVRLWDVESRILRVPPLRHQGWVFDVAFSPDGKTILTSSKDHMAQLWDVATGVSLGPHHQLASWTWSTTLGGVAFNPNGKSFLISDGEDTRLFRTATELPDDLERVATWVEVLTGMTLDPQHGDIQVLDNAAWLEHGGRLMQLGGSPDTGVAERLDPILFGQDPTARARAWMQRGRWETAEAAFDEVVRARPYNATSWLGRGELHMARGQLERAATDFAGAIRVQPDNPRLHYFHILSLLNQGGRSGLQPAYSDLLARYGGAANPSTANTVAWSCALVRDVVADRETPVRLAEAALASFPPDQKPVVMNTLGATLYRAGRFQEAISRLEEGIQKRGGESLPQDWAFLALAHHQLGHHAEAHSWLDRLRAYPPNKSDGAYWNELEIRLLRREAEAMILYDPSFPTDPFAH